MTSVSLLTAFAGIASALFVTELTDKDAILLLTMATRTRPLTVFLAGATAFAFTTAVIVSFGSLALRVVPISWIKLAGGGVMIAYAILEVRGLVGQKTVEREEGRLEKRGTGWRGFFAFVAALVLLDLAGDATEILTVVFVAQYSDASLVFAASCAGLFAATAAETALGNRLAHVLTRERIRLFSIGIFLILGTFIIFSTSA